MKIVNAIKRKITTNSTLEHCKKKIRIRLRRRNKVFVIGFNKTGTTSMAKTLGDLGYIVGDQNAAELLFEDVAFGKYENLIAYCKTAEAFQDVPFSLPKIYKELDIAFPKSKFILTIRDSEHIWYQSLVNFHSRLFGNGVTPSRSQLMNANYKYKGFIYNVLVFGFGLPLYDPLNYKQSYRKHIEDVIQYFVNRPNDLLVLNLTDANGYEKLCNFLDVTPNNKDFPWVNKTFENYS